MIEANSNNIGAKIINQIEKEKRLKVLKKKHEILVNSFAANKRYSQPCVSQMMIARAPF